MRVHLTDLDLATLVPTITALGGTAAIVVLGALLLREPDVPARDARGIARCPVGAEVDLLAPAALECWFDAARGPWRTRSRVWVYGVLVIHVEAASLLDAEEIARRFVAERGDEFLEIAVYVQREPAARSPVTRRVSWTRQGGFETLEFGGLPS